MGVLLRRMVCAAAVGAFLAPTLALAGPAPVSDPRAVSEYEAAGTAYEAEDYEKALEHIKKAYAIEQSPKLLWSWATLERQLGNYKVAAGLYEAFLEQSPNSSRAGEAATYLVEMRALAGEPITPGEDGDGDAGENGDEPPPPDDEDDDNDDVSPLKGEKLAPILLGVGAVVTITGGVLMGIGRSRHSNAGSQPTEQAYFNELDVSRNVYYAGAATLGVGGLIMIGGAIRYAIVAKRGKTPKSTASAMVTPRGFGLSFSGRF